MDLQLDNEQRGLRDTMEAFFAKESPADRVAEVAVDGIDRGLWRKMIALGGPGLAVDESQGGAGLGLLDAVLVCKEAGRRVACVPVAETISATRLLARLQGCADVLDDALDGRQTVILGIGQPQHGMLPHQPWGALADAVIVWDEDELVLVGGGPGAVIPSLGFTGLANWYLEANRRVLATGPEARAHWEQALAEWQLLTASVLTGTGLEALRIGCDYARERIAFGVQIGSFQALQQPLAESQTSLEGIELLVQETAWVDFDGDHWKRQSLMCFVAAGRAAVAAAERALHVHGGYGFTVEYAINLYVRRAKGLSLMLGDPQRLWTSIGQSLTQAV